MSTTKRIHNYETIQQQDVEDNEGLQLENICIHQQTDPTAEQDTDEHQNTINNQGMRLTFVEACKLTKHYKSWILTILIWTWIITQVLFIIINSMTNIPCISIAVICPQNNWQFNNHAGSIMFIIIISIVILLYILETCLSSSCRYVFSTVINNNDCQQYIAIMKQKRQMEIWWNIECYHMYSRRVYTGRGTHSTRQEKAVTHRARRKFDYASCIDVSKFNMKQISNMINKYGIANITFDIKYQFANKETEDEYNRQKEEFIMTNRSDTSQRIWTVEYPRDRDDYNGTASFTIENQDWLKSNASKYLNASYYVLASILLCLPCYKWWMTTIVGDNKYKTYRYTFMKELNIFLEKDLDTLVHGMFRSIVKGGVILPNDVHGLIKAYCGDAHIASKTATQNNNLYTKIYRNDADDICTIL